MNKIIIIFKIILLTTQYILVINKELMTVIQTYGREKINNTTKEI